MKFNLQFQFALLCGLFWISTHAQTYTISGNVLDQSSGEPLIGATVMVAGTPYGVVTNNYGYYSLELAQGEYTVQVSYLGFELHTQTVRLNENQRLDFKLPPQQETLDEIVLVSEDQPNEPVR